MTGDEKHTHVKRKPDLVYGRVCVPSDGYRAINATSGAFYESRERLLYQSLNDAEKIPELFSSKISGERKTPDFLNASNLN